MRSPGIHSTKRYGPVPTGWRPNSRFHLRTAVGDTIAAGPIARLARNGAYGRSISNCTRSGPAARTWRMLWYARVQTKSASCAGCSGTICRSNENTTASASNGVPSWKRTFGRSSNVQIVPSALTVQLVARSASGSRRPGEKRTSRP